MGPTELVGDDWLELLVDGMTFDLLGLAPALPLTRPPLIHLFAYPDIIDSDDLDAAGLFPGSHIADGAHTLPVVRTLLGLGAELATQLPGVAALCWSPARSAMGTPYFLRITENWLAGGAFPALGLTGIIRHEDGSLGSEGLAFFIGQEIHLAAELSTDPVAATRLATRLVHELVAIGPVVHPLEMAVEGAGRLLLDPRTDDASIRITAM